jgi:hypothetical protein
MLTKAGIVNALGRKHGLRRYLELCTPTTGTCFADIDRTVFAVCDRLMYRCPPDYEDGLPLTFRTPRDHAGPLLRLLAAALGRMRYDIILVDGWHSYASTSTDLFGAWHLLGDDGIMVVHDCDPQDCEAASPEWRQGAWCGVAYAAFLDFVLPRTGVSYYTVDTDFGCGVVYRQPARSAFRPAGDRFDIELEWRMADSFAAKFAVYLARRRDLLNLIGAAEFLALEGLEEPPAG